MKLLNRIGGGGIWLLAAAAPAAAAELHIHFTALERILAEQVFTQEGRKYVQGGLSSRCSYAYLERPKIDELNGRLRIVARFSGRSARSFFGKCIGLGDSFDVTIAAAPAYQDGYVTLKHIEVASARDSVYIRRVRKALAASLARDFRYRIADDARTLLEPPPSKTAWRQELMSFQVTRIAVTPRAVVLTVEFQLAVK